MTRRLVIFEVLVSQLSYLLKLEIGKDCSRGACLAISLDRELPLRQEDIQPPKRH